jgi:hypothetical protein|tara:strand:- start:436 stop:732 length:297 start_codon:yes stop_codon:yes gene_type:complete
MSSETRKFRRKDAAKNKKKAQQEMATKVALFGKIPDHCLTCEEPFDKMDKEQVASWNVVVNEKEEEVRLYCPPCWQKAQQIIKDFKKHLQEKYEQPKS